MIRSLRTLLFAIAVVAVPSAACGDSDPATDPSPAATSSASAPTPVPTRPIQPVGERMIDVGGHKLAIRCQGQAAPTVIFEAGAFPVTDEYAGILPDVARDHRVCSYDRAGVGKSEAGPNPRDGKQIALELDRLLANAGETGPFVLVSWSVGAIYTPLYAVAHPDNVAGLVFIDPRTAAYQLRVGSDPRLTTVAADLPPAYGEELRAWDQTATDVENAGALPDRPLIVLTAGAQASIDSANTREGGYDLWRSSHADLAASVSGGKQIIVDDAEHDVWVLNPKAVLDAINTVAGG